MAGAKFLRSPLGIPPIVEIGKVASLGSSLQECFINPLTPPSEVCEANLRAKRKGLQSQPPIEAKRFAKPSSKGRFGVYRGLRWARHRGVELIL
ncbi:hypothetical protein RRG08_057363 [Elysia crispata]|uniref:Uncharacterized protein n=1 Tax=Elysia crispata TaxID=231223 RepID=A0AAE0YKC1_9GAST|nr:hypothetical protein RRG08_057363 [Elysia crispata]